MELFASQRLAANLGEQLCPSVLALFNFWSDEFPPFWFHAAQPDLGIRNTRSIQTFSKRAIAYPEGNS